MSCRDVYRTLLLNTLMDTWRDPDRRVRRDREWNNGYTLRGATRRGGDEKGMESGREIRLTSREIRRSGWLAEEWSEVSEDDRRR